MSEPMSPNPPAPFMSIIDLIAIQDGLTKLADARPISDQLVCEADEFVQQYTRRLGYSARVFRVTCDRQNRKLLIEWERR